MLALCVAWKSEGARLRPKTPARSRPGGGSNTLWSLVSSAPTKQPSSATLVCARRQSASALVTASSEQAGHHGDLRVHEAEQHAAHSAADGARGERHQGAREDDARVVVDVGLQEGHGHRARAEPEQHELALGAPRGAARERDEGPEGQREQREVQARPARLRAHPEQPGQHRDARVVAAEIPREPRELGHAAREPLQVQVDVEARAQQHDERQDPAKARL